MQVVWALYISMILFHRTPPLFLSHFFQMISKLFSRALRCKKTNIASIMSIHQHVRSIPSVKIGATLRPFSTNEYENLPLFEVLQQETKDEEAIEKSEPDPEFLKIKNNVLKVFKIEETPGLGSILNSFMLY